MRIDLGYILGHACELALFLYFANTSFLPRKGYYTSIVFAIVGYIILFVTGLFGYPQLSIVMFSIINFVLLFGLYRIRIMAAIFYSLTLNLLSAVGEYLVIYMIGLNYSDLPLLEITPVQSLTITIGGKMFYLIGILVIKYFMNKNAPQNNHLIALSVVPASTIVSLTFVMTSDLKYYAFVIICIMYIIMNAVVFAINEVINRKNYELKMLQLEYNQNKAELSEYQLLSEKYENTKIMRHDFRKQLSVLKRLIAVDNQQANEYMTQLEYAQREISYTQYTDNKILNILLSEKIKESHEHGVVMHIQSTAPKLGFISEIDTVAIFSNLIDNAIDASENSTEKVIFIDMYTVNDTYSVVKMENSADKEPIVLDGILRTQKLQKNLHGLGVKSINNTLKKYGSKLIWSYDKDNKFFRAVVLVRG